MPYRWNVMTCNAAVMVCRTEFAKSYMIIYIDCHRSLAHSLNIPSTLFSSCNLPAWSEGLPSMFILDRFQKLRLIQENNGHRSLAHSLNRTHAQNHPAPPLQAAVMVCRADVPSYPWPLLRTMERLPPSWSADVSSWSAAVPSWYAVVMVCRWNVCRWNVCRWIVCHAMPMERLLNGFLPHAHVHTRA